MPQEPQPSEFARNVELIGRIDAVPVILDVVCRLTGMGFAAVARVTEGRWVACAVRDLIGFGLTPGGELKVETTICHEIRQSGEAVIIDHVENDAAFCNHPTPAMYGFQSYISMPIFRSGGQFWGTLCAIDPKPANLRRPEIIETFRLFGELIASQLDTQEQLLVSQLAEQRALVDLDASRAAQGLVESELAASQAALLSEREAAELRDQFIAVLGHDLRNPLASVQSGLRLLARPDQAPNRTAIISAMQASVFRMGELIANVLDFARGRLGGGVGLDLDPDAMLGPALEHVVDELRTAHPDRTIKTEFALHRPVAADKARVGQLLSNLVGNALTHGAKDAPVHVRAISQDSEFELYVANAGAPISPDKMARLFQPFYRVETAGRMQGLGLGLYIAQEIARAHGGRLTVSSTLEETRFTFRMPLA